MLAWWRDRRNTSIGSELFARTMHLPELAASGTVAPGQTFKITFQYADPADERGLFLLLLGASGPAATGPGLALGADRWIGLRFDAWTDLSLQAAPFLSLVPVIGRRAATVPITVPAGVTLPPLWAAGVVLRSGAAGFGTVTDTLRLR